jgi:hypothetical protein
MPPDSLGPPPIIWVNTPAKLSAADLDRKLEELEGYLRRGRPYILLFDQGDTLPDAMQRKKLVEHMRKNEREIQRWVLGLGVVVASVVARNVVTAILWFAPPKVPHGIFASRAEAEAWALALQAKDRPA